MARRSVAAPLLLVLLVLGACAPRTGVGTPPSATPGVSTTSAALPAATAVSESSATVLSPSAVPSPTAASAGTPATSTASPPTAAAGTPPTAAPPSPTSAAAAAATATASPAPLPATATPTADRSLALIQESFTLLMQKFFKPLHSKDLLTTAWEAANAEARREGAKGSTTTPDFSGESVADLAAFSRQYLTLVNGLSGDHAQVAFAAAQAMASSLQERHTYFLTPAQAQQFSEESSGQSSLVGIGVTITTSGSPALVTDVFANSPAQQAGVRPGDAIVSVDARSMTDAAGDQLTAALTGQAGTTVRLGLQRPDGTTVTLPVTRGQVFVPILESHIVQQNCYVRLRNFPFADQVLPDGKTVLQELEADLRACEDAHVTGWILDLRGDPGGADVGRFSSRFIGDGVLSTSRDRLNAAYRMAPDGQLFPQQHPLAVLVDGGSASSSEILASAVQDLHRGVVVGVRSAGVVNGTELIPLPLGAMLGVAVEQVLRDTNGPPLDGSGVTPDVRANAEAPTAAQLAAGTDSQIAAAVQALAGGQHGSVPASPTPGPLLLSEQELLRQLGPLVPDDQAVPESGTGKRATLVVDTLDGYATDSPDLAQARARAVRLGFRGEVIRHYGPVDSPTYSVGIALYAAAAGAHDDLARVYQPGELRNPDEDMAVVSPVQLGDETVARVGTGPSTGTAELMWRHGPVLFDLQHNGNPGDVPFTAMAAVARAIESRYSQYPPQG